MQPQAAVNPPVKYNESARQIPKDDGKVRLEATRYVFNLGDFIEPGDKRQLRTVGGWTGGLRVGPSQTEGAPTMWRSNYIINRACFTPLETVATTAGSDVNPKDLPSARTIGTDDLGAPIIVREVLPGNDILMLQDDTFREMGVVEITELSDKPFNLGESVKLNRVFFPELDNWLAGETEFPVLLNDYIDIVNRASITSDAEAITQEQILESARRFETYARKQIETNRQAIMRVRQTDMGGYTVGWSQRTRLFARQLDITLEDDNVYNQREKLTISGSGTIEDPAIKAKEIELQEESNRLKREELEFLKEKWAVEAKVKEVTTKKDTK